ALPIYRLELVLVDKGQHLAEVLGVAHLAAQHGGAAQEDVGGVDLELVAGGGSVDHDAGAGVDAAHVVGKARARGAVDHHVHAAGHGHDLLAPLDRKSTRLNSSHVK